MFPFWKTNFVKKGGFPVSVLLAISFDIFSGATAGDGFAFFSMLC